MTIRNTKMIYIHVNVCLCTEMWRTHIKLWTKIVSEVWGGYFYPGPLCAVWMLLLSSPQQLTFQRKCVHVCAHTCIFYPHPRILLLTWERDWEVWERETSIDCFPHMPDLGIKHTTFRCMEHWFKQLSHLARAVCVFLKPSSICVNSNDYAIEALWSYLTLRGLVRIATQLNDGINKIRFHVLQIGSRYYFSPR